VQHHTGEITSVAINKQHVFASASKDKTVYISLNDVVLRHEGRVRHVVFSPNGDLLASASKDTCVRLWKLGDNGSPEREALILAHLGGADCVAFTPDGKLLASGGRDNLIRLWDVETALKNGRLEINEALVVLQGHDKPVLTLAFNPAGTMLTFGSGDNSVKLWGIT
jgi:WD40 repeat protein